MNTLEIREGRVTFPNARNLSRFKRYPANEFIAQPSRKRNAISRIKLLSLILLAFFAFVTGIQEGVRSWLKHSERSVETRRDFSVPRGSSSFLRGNQPMAVYQPSPVNEIGLLRERNRYRVDMARENNRFMSNVLGHAERMASRLSSR